MAVVQEGSMQSLDVKKLLIVMPSWIGDSVMATPALRAIRRAVPEAVICALGRPGIEVVLDGCPYIDDYRIGRARGIRGSLRTARMLEPIGADTALLFPNSFITAIVARLARIPNRIGYNRDRRGLLLTHTLDPPRREDGKFAVISAVDYYLDLVRHIWGTSPGGRPLDRTLELWTSPNDEQEADRVLAAAGVGADERFAVLNPGANRTDKRWPAERFAQVADHLSEHHGTVVAVTGAPQERPVLHAVVEHARTPVVDLTRHGTTLLSLKAILRRAALLITNDTGPRHMAVAMGTPVVALFGPTDPRWTTLDFDRQIELMADPTLGSDELADEQPERCRIDRIEVDRVIAAADALLQSSERGDCAQAD
jgi:heptosyltransferase-2